MNAIELGRTLPLTDVIVVDPVAKELYGVSDLVVDETALRLKFDALGLSDGFDDALHQVEARLYTMGQHEL